MRFRAFVLHPTWCRASPSPIKGEEIPFISQYVYPFHVKARIENFWMRGRENLLNDSPEDPESSGPRNHRWTSIMDDFYKLTKFEAF
jgi:hypothetical protein